MPAMVWRGGKDALWPINGDKASVAVASAVIAAITGKYPSWSSNFLHDYCKEYFETIFLTLEVAKGDKLDSEFMTAVFYLFKSQEVGDIRDPDISTEFSEIWGRGLRGRKYADIDSGDDCHIRRRVLEYGEKAYEELSPHIQKAIDWVAPHIPPMLERVVETR
jgi:hypothetical protein